MNHHAVALIGLLFVNAAEAEPVTVHTFVRAETDAAIKLIYDKAGFGVFLHNRAPTSLDEQFVIRMNRDTLYSTAVLDLKKLATVKLPEANGRYMSLHVINQDHFSLAVSEPGTHELN